MPYRKPIDWDQSVSEDEKEEFRQKEAVENAAQERRAEEQYQRELAEMEKENRKRP